MHCRLSAIRNILAEVGTEDSYHLATGAFYHIGSVDNPSGAAGRGNWEKTGFNANLDNGGKGLNPTAGHTDIEVRPYTIYALPLIAY